MSFTFCCRLILIIFAGCSRASFRVLVSLLYPTVLTVSQCRSVYAGSSASISEYSQHISWNATLCRDHWLRATVATRAVKDRPKEGPAKRTCMQMPVSWPCEA